MEFLFLGYHGMLTCGYLHLNLSLNPILSEIAQDTPVEWHTEISSGKYLVLLSLWEAGTVEDRTIVVVNLAGS